MHANCHGSRIFIRVVGAVVVRDIKTKFGGGPIGFLFSIGMPFFHLAILMGIYAVTGRAAPVGTDRWAFLGSTVIPFILYAYPARFVTMGLIANRPLLYFPRVKISSLILARIVTEVAASFIAATIFYAILILLGVDVLPYDPALFFLGLLSAMSVGIAVGSLSSLLAVVLPFWVLLINVSMPLIFTISATFILPSMVPDQYRVFFAYNPLAQSIEMMRTGLYQSYESYILSELYPFYFSAIVITLALLFGRFGRGLILRI